MPTPVIAALSPLTIQKIAAGEVIERPANVVKELVENALDAGATKVTITLEDGGKELIRVADNGFGMTRADVDACWKPHTTSKIRAVEDLDSVSSFGFRGEALASMASVSELTIETRHWEEEVGTRLRVVESNVEEVGVAARGQGTTISVRNLFRNNPVRRKFLGTAKAETSRITTLLTRLALAHPDASFRLAEGGGGVGGRELLHLPEGTLRRRAGDVLGVHLLEDLVAVDWEGGGIHIQGYVSEPQRFSGRPGQQHFFVNRRNVYHQVLSRALSQAYEVVPPGRHPVAALFLSISPSEIDVNVHPTKREIRFLNEARVFWALSQALRTALRGVIDAPALELASSVPDEAGVHDPDALERSGQNGGVERHSGVGPDRGASPQGDERTIGNESIQPSQTIRAAEPGFAPAFTFVPHGETGGATSAPTGLSERESALDNVSLFPTPARPAPSSYAVEFTGAPSLQIHGSFILVAVRGGFLLVNQRAAHERILYEKALDDLRRPGRFSAQQLLFPELVEFGAAEASVVEAHLNELRGLGFDLEPFGATAFQLRGSPADAPSDQAQTILQDLVGRLLDDAPGSAKGKVAPEEVHKRVARAFARAAAVPLDTPLDAPRMAALVDGLFATQNPYVTPGGLPVLIRYSLDEIRRRFGLKGDD